MPKKIAHEDAEAIMLAFVWSKSLHGTAPTGKLVWMINKGELRC